MWLCRILDHKYIDGWTDPCWVTDFCQRCGKKHD